ncbi:MAG TPA: hypothetical protein EYN66_14720 [Myxococcales bacterium]|nr:hypothetical protein [Myxococcales bacterium]
MRNLLDMFGRKQKVGPVDFVPTEVRETAVWQPKEIDHSKGGSTGAIPKVDFEDALESASTEAASPAGEPPTAAADAFAGDSAAVDAAPASTVIDQFPPDYSGIDAYREESSVAEPRNIAAEEAFQRGRDEAIAEVDAEIESMRSEFASAVRNVQELSTQLTSRYCSEAVELAASIAKAVVGEELKISPDVMVKIVQRALDEVPESGNLVIRCHPDDLAVMHAHIPELTQHRGAPVSVRAAVGSNVERGGCIIQFEEGAVDAQPSVSVEVMKEAVEASLAGRRALPLED